MAAGDRARHRPRLIVVRKLTEARDGDGPRGKTLAGDPSASPSASTGPRRMNKPKTRGDKDHDETLDDERRVIIIDL